VACVADDRNRLADVPVFEPEIEQRTVLLRAAAKAEWPQERVVEFLHPLDVGHPQVDMVEDHSSLRMKIVACGLSL